MTIINISSNPSSNRAFTLFSGGLQFKSRRSGGLKFLSGTPNMTRKAWKRTFYAHLFRFDLLAMTCPMPTRQDRLAFHSKLSEVKFYYVKLSVTKSKSCSDHRNCLHVLLLVVMVFTNWISNHKQKSHFEYVICQWTINWYCYIENQTKFGSTYSLPYCRVSHAVKVLNLVVTLSF